jgi:hypothetical protein
MHGTARAVLALSLLFAGPALADQAPSKAESLTSVLERIRQDVGYYEVQAARRRADIADPTKQDRLPDAARLATDDVSMAACDTSDLDFDVTDVRASLQAVTAETGGGSVGLRVPLLGKEGSVDADVSRQASGTETVTLTRRFHYSTKELASYQESDDYRQLEAAHTQYHARDASAPAVANPVLPIADTLLELRKNLMRSAAKLPCFEWAENDAKPENSSITLEFLVQQAVDGTVGFNFWIISAKADGRLERTNVNTLVISFAPHGRAVPTARTEPREFGQARGGQSGG